MLSINVSEADTCRRTSTGSNIPFVGQVYFIALQRTMERQLLHSTSDSVIGGYLVGSTFEQVTVGA